MAKILVIGASSLDRDVYVRNNPQIYGTTDAEYYIETPGSSGVAKAIALGKLGETVHFHTALGCDEAGEKIRKYLENKNIELTFDNAKSGTNRKIKIIDSAGNKISVHLPGFDDPVDISEDTLKTQIENSDIIVLNHSGYNKRIMHLIRNCGKPVWSDLHDYLENDPEYQDLIDVSDYIFMSSDRLTGYREVMKKLGAEGKLIVCTHGKEGSTAFFKDKFYEQSAYDFVPVDTTCAGDIYFAGFLSEYIKKGNLERSLMYASIAGGLSIEARDTLEVDLSHKRVEQTLLSKGIFDKSYQSKK